MASQDKPDVNTVWASEGTVEPIDVAKQELGYVEEIPFWDNFNWLMQQVTGFMKHVNQEGIARWDPDTSYTTNSWAKGTNGVVYISLKPDHVGNNPTTANSTFWQSITDYIAAAMPGRLLNIQTFTASGTYTPTAGTKRIRIRLCGGGGAGGSGVAPTDNSRRGGGGGAGGYLEAFVLNPVPTTVTIGVGGNPVSAITGQGGTGGQSRFGTGFVASGGVGGGNKGPSNAASGGLGGSASGGYLNIVGGDGSDSSADGGSGDGGGNAFGGGARGGNSTSTNPGSNTKKNGCGGGGSNSVGAPGADGLCIIEEYS